MLVSHRMRANALATLRARVTDETRNNGITAYANALNKVIMRPKRSSGPYKNSPHVRSEHAGTARSVKHAANRGRVVHEFVIPTRGSLRQSPGGKTRRPALDVSHPGT
jgi:hypothetical protein